MRFQSTLPRGERRLVLPLGTSETYFNPHSRVGSDNQGNMPYRKRKKFQSTLPRGERLQNCTKAILTKVKFYALLHAF